MLARSLIADPSDNVGIALDDLAAGECVDGIILKDRIPAGHKFALRLIEAGATVIKLGHMIGRAVNDINQGDHVHLHNLRFMAASKAATVYTPAMSPPAREASFAGFLRDDGRAGTRNFIGILTSVNCSATVARRIAAHFTTERLAGFPNVDGIVAFSHMSGCGMASDGRGLRNLQRTMAGYATHPKFSCDIDCRAWLQSQPD